MRARKQILCCFLLAMLMATAAHAGQGLVLVGATPSRNGAATVHVEVTEPRVLASLKQPGAASFQAVVKAGQAKVESSQLMADTGETVYTLLAFDTSASFQPHLASAISVAHAFVDALPTRVPHKTGVMTFGVGANVSKEATTQVEMHQLVDAVRAVPPQPATRLKSSISESVQLAGSRQPMPSGLRQVVLFTDAGEESRAYTISPIIKQARSMGVRIHVVVFRSAAQSAKGYAQYRDELRQLAEESGGRDITVQDEPSAKALVSTIAKTSESTFRVSLKFCDVPRQPVNFDDDLVVEVWQAQTVIGRSDAYLLSQQASGAAIEPCAPPPCSSQGPCPSASVAPPPVVTTPLPDKSKVSLLLVGGGLGGLLLAALIGGLIWATRRTSRSVPPRAPVPVPLPVVPLPAVLPPPLAPVPVYVPVPVPVDPFAVLPETRLVVLRGLSLNPPYYRVSLPVFQVGARADMHLVLDVDKISGHHTTFELRPDGVLTVMDAGSRNGTFVDGICLAPGEKRRIFPGQRVGLSTEVEFRLEQPGVMARDPGFEPKSGEILRAPASVGQSVVADGPAKKGLTIVDSEEPWKGRR